jgi:hypothetical protein
VLGIEHRAFRDTELVAVDEEAAAGIIQKFECEAVAGIGIDSAKHTDAKARLGVFLDRDVRAGAVDFGAVELQSCR